MNQQQQIKQVGQSVHVVAWQYAGGAGFDWYHDPGAANKAFEDEKQNVAEFADQEWTAFRFDVDVSGYSNATREIDADLDELCALAALRVGPMTFPRMAAA